MRISDPPSLSKVSESTSVLIIRRSLAAEGAPKDVPTGTAVAELVGALADGTDPLPEVGPGGAAGGAVVWTLEGKKVALPPLETCHWSHSKTMENPKITHKMVRRMSFMTASF